MAKNEYCDGYKQHSINRRVKTTSLSGLLGPSDKMFKILKVLSDKQEMNSQVLGCRDGHILYIKNNFTL